MNKNDLKILIDAVKRSPDNIALRLSLGLKLFKIKEYEESEKNYQHVLKLDAENVKAKQGLIELYYAKGNYSAVIVIAEELAHRNISSEKIMELQVKSLLKQNSVSEAQELYNKILDRNPFYYDEELDSVLKDEEEYFSEGLKGDEAFSQDDEFDEFDKMGDFNLPDFLSNPQNLMLPKTEEGFEAVIGNQYLKDEIYTLYIHMDIDEHTKSKFKISSTNSLLMYGPPGCGKSHITKYLPYELDIDVLPFDWSRMNNNQSVNKDYVIPFYFNVARMQSPCTLLIDHLDLVIYNRAHPLQEEEKRYASQFLAEMDSMYAYDSEITVIGATNTIWNLNSELFRYGRFDNLVFVKPPSKEDRLDFFTYKNEELQLNIRNYDELVALTHLYSFADLENIFQKATKEHLSIHLEEGNKIKPISIDALIRQIKKSKSSILYWFDDFIQNSTPSFKRTAIYDEVRNYIESEVNQ